MNSYKNSKTHFNTVGGKMLMSRDSALHTYYRSSIAILAPHDGLCRPLAIWALQNVHLIATSIQAEHLTQEIIAIIIQPLLGWVVLKIG